MLVDRLLWEHLDHVHLYLHFVETHDVAAVDAVAEDDDDDAVAAAAVDSNHRQQLWQR